MVKKFFESYWFNVVLAVLAGLLAVMQEVWIGTAFSFLGFFGLGTAVAFCFSWGAEVIGKIFFKEGFEFKWSDVLVGGIAGTITVLLLVLLL